MPRTPRSHASSSAAAGSGAMTMAIALGFAAIAVAFLAIIVLVPIVGEPDGTGNAGVIAAADAPGGDPLAANMLPDAAEPGGTEPSPIATVAAEPTPRPRRSIAGRSPSPAVLGVAGAPVEPGRPTERAAPRPTRTPEARPTRTPEPAATTTPIPRPTATAAPTPTREPDVIAYYLAEAAADLQAWSGPSWRADGATLRSDGSAVLAQPWVSGPVAPPVRGGYAVEAEFRIDGLAAGYCKQSVGIIVPLPSGAFAGAGLIYECDASNRVSGSRARITDVSDYTNGYFQDPELAARSLDLKSGWHTLRIEVDGDKIRLMIDGDLSLTATAGEATSQNPAGALGLWSEGVEVSIRRIAVVELETS